MSESKADRSRYWVAFMLRDLPEGDNFSVEELHLTVLPWFVTDDYDDAQIIDSFVKTFAGIQFFNIKIGEEVAMGGRAVKANLVESDSDLKGLHQKALGWFNHLGGRWAIKNPYVDSDYKPHIRRRNNTKLNLGDSLRLTNLSLIRAARQEDWQRQVAARIELEGGTA